MIGLVVVTHGNLGSELINTAELILGNIENAQTVGIEGQSSPESIRDQIGKAIKSTDRGKGVIILTDMFGGTPSNVSLSFMSNGNVEVLSGVNLPMVIKLVQARSTMPLDQLIQTIGEYARNSINVASEKLGWRPKPDKEKSKNAAGSGQGGLSSNPRPGD